MKGDNDLRVGHIYFDRTAKLHVFITKIIKATDPFYTDVEYYYLYSPQLIRRSSYGICYTDFREINDEKRTL